ncbi:MAG: hypothetical protein QF898_16685 [SAR202 cluster bacterium]|nr:hypothetical protein [SAR202 cluster bacterium]MDP6511860.1 hypothetical protein [SAR202 cluster bacterium]MDP6715055.1 hypothetical protein [SAR202 cluster bacterium]
MYLIRRIFNTKPGEARKVAELVKRQGEIYRDAGQRSEITVSYNGATLPGEQNVVVLQWTAEAIESPSRPNNPLPPEALEVGAQVRPLIESQRIEFMELLT